MAKRFLSASSQVFGNTGISIASNSSVTVSAWFYPFQTNGDCEIIQTRSSGTLTSNPACRLRAGAAGKVVVIRNAAGVGTNSSSASYVANQWQFAGAYVTTSGNAVFYANILTTNAGAVPSGTHDYLYIGGNHTAFNYYYNGLIAEVGVWTAQLTESEFRLLAQGVRPLEIRPQSLCAYYPLRGEGESVKEFDAKRSNQPLWHLDGVNSPTLADHPPMRQPNRRRRVSFSTGTLSPAAGQIFGIAGAQADSASLFSLPGISSGVAPTVTATLEATAALSAVASGSSSPLSVANFLAAQTGIGSGSNQTIASALTAWASDGCAIASGSTSAMWMALSSQAGLGISIGLGTSAGGSLFATAGYASGGSLPFASAALIASSSAHTSGETRVLADLSAIFAIDGCAFGTSAITTAASMSLYAHSGMSSGFAVCAGTASFVGPTTAFVIPPLRLGASSIIVSIVGSHVEPSIQGESFVALSIRGGLPVAVRQSIEVFRGEDRDILCTVSGITSIANWALAFSVRESANASEDIIRKDTSSSSIFINSAVRRTLTISLSSRDLSIPVGTYYFTLARTDQGDREVLSYGSFQVKASTTTP